MTGEGDLVLVYQEEKPAVYARVESIDPDLKRGWYHVGLLFLTVPTQLITWILRRSYIDGETFTMGGKPLRLEKIERTVPPKPGPDEEKSKTKGPGAVIPFRRPPKGPSLVKT